MKQKMYYFTETSPDLPLKEFWSSNEHFAELFNSYMFNGTEVLKPELLRDLSPDVSVSIFSKEFQKTIRRTRDVLKVTETGEYYRILGIENQQAVHYAMPLRTMVYDMLTYLQEMEKITRNHRKEKDFTSVEEFLSGFTKEDKLHSCHTIVIYWGEQEWNAPRCLSEMMAFEPDDWGKDQFNDYQMHLLCVNESEGRLTGNGDVFQLFTAVREMYRNGGENFSEVLSDVSLEVAYITTLVTKTTKQYEKVLTEAIENRKERINMCEAARKAFEKKQAEGELKALYDLVKDHLLSPEVAAKRLGLTTEEFLEMGKRLS